MFYSSTLLSLTNKSSLKLNTVNFKLIQSYFQNLDFNILTFINQTIIMISSTVSRVSSFIIAISSTSSDSISSLLILKPAIIDAIVSEVISIIVLAVTTIYLSLPS